MDPITMMALMGGASSLYGLMKPKSGALPTDYWKQYFSPERIQMMIQPGRQAIGQQMQAGNIQAGERWGGVGLQSSAGATAQGIQREQGGQQALAQLMAQATGQEMQTASQLGLADWMRQYQEGMAQKEGAAKLGGTLMQPYAMKLGQQQGVESMKGFFDWITKTYPHLGQMLGLLPKEGQPIGAGAGR